jgi:hypothetical protein
VLVRVQRMQHFSSGNKKNAGLKQINIIWGFYPANLAITGAYV